MDTKRAVQLSPAELVHEKVLREVLAKMQDTPYVLKGGTALSITRNFPRHSTDLDFDSGKRLNVQRRVLEGLKAAGVEVTSINIAKDTDTVQRFKTAAASLPTSPMIIALGSGSINFDEMTGKWQ